MQNITELLQKTDNLVIIHEERIARKKDLDKKILALEVDIEEKSKHLDLLIRTSTLIGNVSDEMTQKTLDKITGVINRALEVMFVEDLRKIHIEQTIHNKVYPHYIVKLTNSEGIVRSFNQSGTGLGQTISFLFAVTLIDARKGRKLVVIDEILNGLHPDAKAIIRDLMIALSKRFQFIVVEYGLDIGKMFEVKKSGKHSTVIHYENGAYYQDLYKKIIEDSLKEGLKHLKEASPSI